MILRRIRLTECAAVKGLDGFDLLLVIKAVDADTKKQLVAQFRP